MSIAMKRWKQRCVKTRESCVYAWLIAIVDPCAATAAAPETREHDEPAPAVCVNRKKCNRRPGRRAMNETRRIVRQTLVNPAYNATLFARHSHRIALPSRYPRSASQPAPAYLKPGGQGMGGDHRRRGALIHWYVGERTRHDFT
jgi:hypothetical protein